MIMLLANNNTRAIQRQCLLLIILLSWIDKSYWLTAVVDAQGPPRLSITRRPSNTVAINVITDGLSLPRNRDSIEPSSSSSSSLPSAMPTRLIHVPELTANPTIAKDSSPSSFPSGAPVSIPWNVPPVASPSSRNPPTSPTPAGMNTSIFPTKEPSTTSSSLPMQYPTLDPTKLSSSIQPLITSHSPSVMPSSIIISPSAVAPNDTQPTRTAVVPAVDSEMAVDQVLLKTNKVGIMNTEQVSNFEHVCETDFLPIYLVKVYPSVNYTNITCTIMSQSVFESTTSGVPGDIILAVLLRIQSNVNLLTKSSPSFDDIIAEVVSAYTPELQELLVQSNPEETYFVDTTTNDTESSSNDNNNHRPIVAIIASTLSVAFIILGLALIVVSRKRYHQKGGGKGNQSETIKAIRMENQSSSGDDSLYNDEQPKAATIAYNLDQNVYDYDDNVGLDMVEPAMIYEKMSLTSHRSQHERRTYNMSFIGLSSTTSGVSSVTNTPSSFGTNSTTMASSILQSPTSAAAKRATTNSSPSNNGGCSPGLIIPPIVERLYYETLHSTLRLAKMESSQSGLSITTSLSSQKRRGELYSQMDDDESDDEDEDDDTMNSMDEPAKPLPSLIVAITETTQQDESTTKSKTTSTTRSTSSTRRRSGGGGGGDNQSNNNVTSDTSLKEKESTNPPADSSRRSNSSRSSSRSSKRKRNQRGRQRRTSPLTPRQRGRGGKDHNDNDNNNNNNHDCDDDDNKFRMYSHTSVEEMMTDDDDDDTKMDAKLPSVIITITQQEVIKSTRMMPAADQQDEDISSSSLLPVLGIISRPHPPNEQTTTIRPFSSRSMSIGGGGVGGEIIQSVETELSSVSASVGTMTRDGSSSSRDTNDSSSSNDNAAAASNSNRKSDDDNQRVRNDRNSRNRIVNI